MQDFEITIDSGESAKIHFYQGRTLKTVHLWAEDENKFSVAISVEDRERHVVEVLSNGTIETTKIDGKKA